MHRLTEKVVAERRRGSGGREGEGEGKVRWREKEGFFVLNGPCSYSAYLNAFLDHLRERGWGGGWVGGREINPWQLGPLLYTRLQSGAPRDAGFSHCRSKPAIHRRSFRFREKPRAR